MLSCTQSVSDHFLASNPTSIFGWWGREPRRREDPSAISSSLETHLVTRLPSIRKQPRQSKLPLGPQSSTPSGHEDNSQCPRRRGVPGPEPRRTAGDSSTAGSLPCAVKQSPSSSSPCLVTTPQIANLVGPSTRAPNFHTPDCQRRHLLSRDFSRACHVLSSHSVTSHWKLGPGGSGSGLRLVLSGRLNGPGCEAPPPS